MQLTPITIVCLFLTCILLSGLSGYYAASYAPIPPQIAVVNVASLVLESIEHNKSQTEEDAQKLTARIKAKTSELVQKGAVVLDSQYVLDAPDEAYVPID